MLHNSVTPDLVGRSAVTSACEKCMYWGEALRLLQEMLRTSLTPNMVSHNAVISACEKG